MKLKKRVKITNTGRGRHIENIIVDASDIFHGKE